MASYEKDIDKILARLKRIEGQMRGIQRMVKDGKYCVDILTQLSSAIAATEKVGLIVLKDHIKGCVRDSMTGKNADERIDELVVVVERFLKT
ncbi:MAG: metal-sensitive transcriptional regulator [Actinomycetota bacterium]|nr:metal-sensitive transcriptional regulator [Actinomycetota bacterium]